MDINNSKQGAGSNDALVATLASEFRCRIVKKMPFPHNAKFKKFWPKNTITCAVLTCQTDMLWLQNFAESVFEALQEAQEQQSFIKFRLCSSRFLRRIILSFFNVTLRREQLLASLKQFFGFSSFRLLQEEIILDPLDGEDAFAVLPTGSGKLLCFQLPALLRTDLPVVERAAHRLDEGSGGRGANRGVATPFLNLSLAAGEPRPRLRSFPFGPDIRRAMLVPLWLAFCAG